MQIRATTRYRNDRMLRRRKELGLSQKKYAEFLGVPWYVLIDVEKLHRRQAITHDFLAHVVVIAQDLGCEAADVWPEWLAEFRVVDSVRIANLDRQALEAHAQRAQRVLDLTAPPEDLVIKEECWKRLRQVVKGCLSVRQADILWSRLTEPPEPFASIGQRWDIGRSCAHQIFNQAMRRLRQPQIIALLGGNEEAEEVRPVLSAWEALLIRAGQELLEEGAKAAAAQAKQAH